MPVGEVEGELVTVLPGCSSCHLVVRVRAIGAWASNVDALSITFRETTVMTKHLAEGIAADYDSEG